MALNPLVGGGWPAYTSVDGPGLLASMARRPRSSTCRGHVGPHRRPLLEAFSSFGKGPTDQSLQPHGHLSLQRVCRHLVLAAGKPLLGREPELAAGRPMGKQSLKFRCVQMRAAIIRRGTLSR